MGDEEVEDYHEGQLMSGSTKVRRSHPRVEMERE